MAAMPTRHTLLACLVAVLWGVNFLAIHVSLAVFPPMFLVALRFTILAIPTMLLIPRPQVPLRWLVLYGLGFGTLQYFGLYLGMAAGYPTGLASLVLQASAPFTVVLGAIFLHERVTRRAAIGVGVAVAGLLIVGLAGGGSSRWAAFWLVILGAFGWAIGNIASRQADPPKPLNFTLWMSVIPPLPMLALSLLVEGPSTIGQALATAITPAGIPAWIGLAYTVLVASVIASGIWVWLMKRHPAGMVAPYSMLVPVVGIATSWIALAERPSWPEALGAALVIGGVLWSSGQRTATPIRPLELVDR